VNVIVDASVAVKWVVSEELTGAALGLFGRGYRMTAPDFLLVECANVLWKKARRGELTQRHGDRALALLRSFTVDLVSTVTLLDDALALAHEIGHPTYDCLYLAAAQAVDGVVVTADRRFLRAVSPTRLADRIAWIEAPPQSRP